MDDVTLKHDDINVGDEKWWIYFDRRAVTIC